MSHNILLVDDEIDFLDVVSEFITDEGYAVRTAVSGDLALEMLSEREFDLIISDINMPGIKGYELLKKCFELYPKMKRVLITAYDVKDYMRYAKEYDIGNIITKTVPFNFDELSMFIRNIITNDIFGLEKYIDEDVNKVFIRSNKDIEKTTGYILESIEDDDDKRKFRQGLGEILINAFFYGALNEDGSKKYLWKIDSVVGSDKSVAVSWGADSDKYAVAVTDKTGRLSKKDVLYWIERNSVKGENGLSLGLKDSHGKGMFITREIVDSLIINIERGVRTEVIMIIYKNNKFNGHRPLWIQEV